MRIVAFALGSRGDVQPFVALGLGLREAGYDVRLVVFDDCLAMVRSRGLEAASMNAAVRPLLGGDVAQAWLASGRNFFSFLRFLRDVAQPLIRGVLDDCWRVSQDADATIYSTLGFAGWHIAERLGVPVVSALLQPYSRTRAFPNLLFPPVPRLGGTYNLFTHVVGDQMIWQLFSATVNRWRRQTLGLPSIPFGGPFRQVYAERVPYIFGYSPSVVPKPADWPDWYAVTGYWFLDRQDDWQPPAALADFLAAGPPPVFVGFGSMRPRDPAAFTRLMIEALRRTGQRGVLQAGWGELGLVDLPDDVLLIQDVPHDWLFPRMAVVVHHGGAGTVAAGLRAGVPTVVLPFFADQPFWGQRIAELGVGPPPIAQKQLNLARVAGAINRATDDGEMRARAAALGERIRAEDGVATACAIVDRYLKQAR